MVFRHRLRAAETALATLLVVLWSHSVLPRSGRRRKRSRSVSTSKAAPRFLIRLQQVDKDKPITPGLLDQAVEVIRKRVDYFGGGEPIISPVGQDRILVQIPGLDTAKIQEARDQLSRVAKLEFRLVYPDNGERLKAIDQGTEVIPPEYKIENYKHARRRSNEKATTNVCW